MKPITGQYECVRQSGVGLDYFTSRIDRLVLQKNGRFVLTVQDRSRLSNAAQSLLKGEQVSTAAPETKREGSYTLQDNIVSFHFDNGSQEQGQLSFNQEGLQIGKDFFNKVSDSTMIPPTHRLKKDMDDIAKGLKIAGAIGGMAIKAAKTVHDTLQEAQPDQNSAPEATATGRPYHDTITPGSSPDNHGRGDPSRSPQEPSHNQANPVQPDSSPVQPVPQPSAPAQPAQNAVTYQDVDALFCDQCGHRVRPGKRFCNACGARLP